MKRKRTKKTVPMTMERLEELASRAAVHWRTIALVMIGVEVRGQAGIRARTILKAEHILR